jgi:hypothetical protein
LSAGGTIILTTRGIVTRKNAVKVRFKGENMVSGYRIIHS